MGTAAKLDVVDRRRSATRKWHNVVELDECRLAAAAVAASKCTAAGVTRPDGAAHRSRDVTASRDDRM